MIFNKKKLVPLLLIAMVGTTAHAACTPPYSGTAFIDANILTASDPSNTGSMSYSGRGLRTMFDRRVNAFVEYNAYLFDLQFSDGLSAEVQVNPEFGSEGAAEAIAAEMVHSIGQLPRALRMDVQTVWIHQGDEAFGGGNNNLLIHTARAESYQASGVIEEILLHEATHTSLDAAHSESAGWQSAQQSDDCFISTYAEANPVREDLAESFVPYIAVRLRSDRISAATRNAIESSIPARLTYLDDQDLDLRPMFDTADVVFEDEFKGD